jgi:hypothetical protein
MSEGVAAGKVSYYEKLLTVYTKLFKETPISIVFIEQSLYVYT